MEILLLAIKNIDLLPEGLLETLYMTLVSAVFAYAVGLPLGVVLAVTGKNGIAENKAVNAALGFVVNFSAPSPS